MDSSRQVAFYGGLVDQGLCHDALLFLCLYCLQADSDMQKVTTDTMSSYHSSCTYSLPIQLAMLISFPNQA